jgi:Glycosyltransferase family 87
MATTTPQHGAEADRETIKAFAILGGFFFAATLGLYLYKLHGGVPFLRDGSSLVIGRDFLNFWMYGHAATLPDPGRWYDAAVYQHALADLLGPGYPGQNWSYPPTIMLIAAPFGQLGYLPALAIWTLLGIVVVLIAARRLVADRRTLFALIVSPAAVFCIISGQSSLISAAMLIGIFAWLDRRPLLAGLLIGLLTLKPQLGLLIPFLLIASGRWRVFIVAGVTAAALAALAAALFGVDSWIAFITQGLPTQNLVMADPEGIATPFFPTVFMNLRGIGLPYAAAMAVQLCFTLAAAAAIVWAFRYRADADPRLLFALFAACAVAAVPYLLVYDTMILTIAVLSLAAYGLLDRPGTWMARLVFWLPLLQIGLGNLHIPGPGLIAPAVALYFVMRLKQAPGRAAEPVLSAV